MFLSDKKRVVHYWNRWPNTKINELGLILPQKYSKGGEFSKFKRNLLMCNYQ